MIAGGGRVLVEKLESFWAGKPERFQRFPNFLGNQEIEAREIVSAEESGGITEGKEPKRIPNYDYPYLPVTPLYRCLQNKLIVIPIK